MTRRPTLKDVARAAGVSVGTASNVVTGRRPVRAATRAAVEAAVAELGYRPDTAARALIGRRGRTAPTAAPTTPRLTAIGYVCADHRADVEVLPHRDDRALAASIDQRLGGRAANVAVTAAGLGPPLEVAATLISVVGNDADSDWAESVLAERRVRLDPASRVAGARLSRCIILVEPSGHRTILNEPLAVSADVVAAWLARCRTGPAPHAVYVQADQLTMLEPSLAAMAARGLRLATHLGRTDVDALGAATVLDLVAPFDLVVFDRGAARAIVGPLGGDGGLAERLAERVAALRGLAALTLGGDGACLIRGGRVLARATPPPRVPLDTTGAGDTFTGALLAALLHDHPAPAAVGAAALAAAHAVSSKGAQDHGLTAADIIS